MTKKEKHKIIAVVGPTASGKSRLAVELAKKHNGEIISADSRQIYKEFDIATAKPSEDEKAGIVHHLIDIIEPTQEFTVADFTDRAQQLIEDIVSRNKLPIIAGGTGLYLRTLLQDFDIPRVEPNKELRKELETIAESEGVEAVYDMLVELDPVLAQKIHKNNLVKIVRAIEVSKTLNMPMSQAQGRKEPMYDVEWIGLNAENREYLYNRINLRVDEMIEKGLEQEAKNLFEKYGELTLLLSTIGYQEFHEYFKGLISKEEVIEQIKQNTRHYAKRQLTWFRQNKDIKWMEIEG